MLKRLSVANYRSYYEKCTLDFALPTNGKLGLTVLVGRNNSGKSSLLGALSSLCSSERNMAFDRMDRHPTNDPFIQAVYVLGGVEQTIGISKDARAFFRKTSTLSNGIDVPFESLIGSAHPLLAFVPSRRPWEDTFNPAWHGIDLKVFENNRHALSSQNQNPGARQVERLGDQLNGIIYRGEKDQFDLLLKSILPELSDWSTDRISGQDRIIYVSASGAEHAIRDVGDGVTSIFRICFALHSNPASVPLMLDEPELSLHPEGQKRLFQVIREQAKTRQIILATHSPHGIHWPDLMAGAKVYRINQDINGHSLAHTADLGAISKVNGIAHADYKNRKLFDYAGKEIFFASSVLFVEGQEDAHIISKFCEDEGMPELPIFAYGAGGSSHICSWIKLARQLGVTAAALYDNDKKDDAQKAQTEFRDDPLVLIKVLSQDDIRDKVESGAIVKSGTFDRDWRIKPQNRDAFIKLLEDFRRHLCGEASKFTSSSQGRQNVVHLPDRR